MKEHYQVETILLKPGDCVFHNPIVIHGSFSNKSDKNRRAFNFSIRSKNAKKDNILYKKYRENLGDFLKTKNNTRL